jgi:hypothetical protein
MIQIHIKRGVPLEAFCFALPDVKDVTAFLCPMGFSLVYQMKAFPAPFHGVPALPAQYHYQDHNGTQVIYLAGKDFFSEDGLKLPPHLSRWWMYPGQSHEEAVKVVQVLTARWLMAWFAVKENKKEEMP